MATVTVGHENNTDIEIYYEDHGAGGYDQVVFRGDVQGREFIAFWLGGGRVLASMNVNIFGVNEVIQAVVRDSRAVDAGRLANPDVPLEEFLGDRRTAKGKLTSGIHR